MPKYDVDVSKAWSSAYGLPHADPHFIFSTLLGVTRDEAKRICYEYIYSEKGRSTYAINQFHTRGEETRFVYNFFSKCLKMQVLKSRFLLFKKSSI
ncbi:permease protein [Salmonella phage 40]|nr:permease protein [Salmonella phage 40]